MYSDGSWGFFKLGHLDYILLLLDFFHFSGQGLCPQGCSILRVKALCQEQRVLAGWEHFLFFKSIFEFSARSRKILHLFFGLYPSEQMRQFLKSDFGPGGGVNGSFFGLDRLEVELSRPLFGPFGVSFAST